MNENVRISTNISLEFVPRGLINNIPALVQIMAWRLPGDKPLSEPIMVNLLTHICVTRPQWVKDTIKPWSNSLARYSVNTGWWEIDIHGCYSLVKINVAPICTYKNNRIRRHNTRNSRSRNVNVTSRDVNCGNIYVKPYITQCIIKSFGVQTLHNLVINGMS